MGENTIFIWEVNIPEAHNDEEAQTFSRLALARLFRDTASGLEKGITHGAIFEKNQLVTISLETLGWNAKYVLRIKRIDDIPEGTNG